MHSSTHRSTLRPRITRSTALGALFGSLVVAAAVTAELGAQTTQGRRITRTSVGGSLARPVSASRGRSVREMAARDRSFRVVVSLERRQLSVLKGTELIMQAPVAVGSGTTLRGLGQSWTFSTPRGVRTVQRKKVKPVWIPPDWMYVETAKEYGLKVEHLSADRPRKLSSGRKLVIRKGVVRVVAPGFSYTPSLEEHLVFDNILFIPPTSTKNRRIEGELGEFALDTGDGYMLHGTRLQNSIGQRATHGCLRLRDDDIEWLYKNVPVGTRVYLY